MSERAERRRFRIGLAVVTTLVALVWSGYLLAQPRFDPRHDAPGFDSAYYLEWSDVIAGADDAAGRFDGAFYRAPLYAYGLALLRGPLGAGLEAVRWLQALLALAAGVAMAHAAFRWGGANAGIATAALLGAYHPWLFFSTRLLGEGLAIALLAAATAWILRRESWALAAAGLALGLAVLARPNLLLVAVAWVGWAAWRSEWRKAAAVALLVAAVLLPVALRNRIASGHLVPVAANGGLTFHHGNGPGALGVYTAVEGMSAAIEGQRAEATRTAIRLSRADLDAVEADRYWGRQALRYRLAYPLDSAKLLWNRILLTVGSHEVALDEAPGLDPNPWSRAAFVPFALVLGLAAAAGGRRSGPAGWVWIAVLACAATPLLFYVSSRYRLPLSVLLTVPAGVGASRLIAGCRRSAVVAVTVSVLSLAVPWIASVTLPYGRIVSEARADGEAELASSFHERAELASDPAERDHWARAADAAVERAVRAYENSAKAWFVRGMIANRAGRTEEAEEAWSRAWYEGNATSPRVAAAANLAAIWIESGKAGAAERLLREALRLEPLDETCRHNLVVALLATGDRAGARREIARARSLGVTVDPELEQMVRGEG